MRYEVCMYELCMCGVCMHEPEVWIIKAVRALDTSVQEKKVVKL